MALFKLDMQEDTIINGFNSYLLSGTHSETFNVEGIVQTVIYLSNGKTVTIDGYLDIGLIDTIGDMAVCFLGAVVYFILFAIDWHAKKALFKFFIPQVATAQESGSQKTAAAVATVSDEISASESKGCSDFDEAVEN